MTGARHWGHSGDTVPTAFCARSARPGGQAMSSVACGTSGLVGWLRAGWGQICCRVDCLNLLAQTLPTSIITTTGQQIDGQQIDATSARYPRKTGESHVSLKWMPIMHVA